VSFWENNLFYPATDSTLGKWACRQRTLKRRNQLSADRFEALERFGFIWDPPHARQANNWEVLYQECVEFKKQNGHLQVPLNSVLNWWMALQRSYKSSNKLPEERIRDLDAIGFVWSPKKDTDLKNKKSVESKSESGKSSHFLRNSSQTV
jgi:hypothetical protein